MTQEHRHFELDNNPISQFGKWYQDAKDSSLTMPHAMTLATTDSDGHANARIVLLKGWDQQGFRFFTNYQSVKGDELTHTPFASLVFWWEPLLRQIRIKGLISRLSAEDSDAYFHSRPRMSQIGAWASQQSREIESRKTLQQAVTRIEKEFGDNAIPRPPHWGGFLLQPQVIEFWQEQPFRLHDRMQYRRTPTGWERSRLSP